MFGKYRFASAGFDRAGHGPELNEAALGASRRSSSAPANSPATKIETVPGGHAPGNGVWRSAASR
jgi:hypothetical protein